MQRSTWWALTRRAMAAGRQLWAMPRATAAGRQAQAASLYGAFAPAFDEVNAIDADELWRRLGSAAPPLLVDVRGAGERAVSTLRGAVPASAMGERPDLWRSTTLVVAFCTLGIRSGAWARDHQGPGAPVVNLAGGLVAWAHHGGVFVDAQGETTRRLHVGAPMYDLLPEGYEGVWSPFLS